MSGIGVCYPRGFRAAGIAAGLKASGKPDLALVANDGAQPVSAFVTTANRFPAAPVQALRQLAGGNRITHVILNSGNANAAPALAAPKTSPTPSPRWRSAPGPTRKPWPPVPPA